MNIGFLLVTKTLQIQYLTIYVIRVTLNIEFDTLQRSFVHNHPTQWMDLECGHKYLKAGVLKCVVVIFFGQYIDSSVQVFYLKKVVL